MTETPSGAIHDIGYQHYDGPRLGSGPSTRTLYFSSLRSAFGLGLTGKAKVLPFVLAGFMLVPALITQVVLIVGQSLGGSMGFEEQVVAYTDYLGMTQGALAIFVAAQAPVVFSRDLRFRTVTLYFARPLSRLSYVAAKLLALASAIAILCLAPLLLMFVGGLLAELPLDQEFVGFARAATGALVLCLLLSTFGGLIASATPRRGVGVAIIVTVLMVGIALAGAVGQYARIQESETAAGLAVLLSPFTLLDAFQTVLFGVDGNFGELPDGAGWTLFYPGVVIVMIVGLSGLLLARYRKVISA